MSTGISYIVKLSKIVLNLFLISSDLSISVKIRIPKFHFAQFHKFFKIGNPQVAEDQLILLRA